MKIRHLANISEKNAHFLATLMIIAIPFYQIRLGIYSISLSVLTIFSVIFIFYFGAQHYRMIFRMIKMLPHFPALIIFFVISFIPPLLLSPNIHAYGVFIEWILTPAIAGFIVWAYTYRSKKNQNLIMDLLGILLFSVSFIAVLCYSANIVTYDGRVNAFFLSPNHLAMFLVPLLFVCGIRLIAQKNIYIRIFCFLSVFLGLLAIFLTQSFSTVFALSAVVLALSFQHFSKKRSLLIIFALIILTTSFFAMQKLSNSDDLFHRNSLSSRFMIWETSVFLLQKNVVTGYGLDKFQEHYLRSQEYFPRYLEWAVPTPHNLVLHLLITGGFLTLFSFSVLCAYILHRGLSFFYLKDKKCQALLLCGAFAAIILCGIFDTPYWKNDLSIMFWIVAALIMSHAPSPEQLQG